MKMPLAWHRECLDNSEQNLIIAKKYLLQVEANYERLLKGVELKRKQFHEAERLDMEGYDPDKFLTKRV